MLSINLNKFFKIDKITFILFILLFWLQYSFWFGKNGFCDYFFIYKTFIKIKKNNIKARINNKKILKEIEYINNNTLESIKGIALSKLGIIKKS
ncbi:septum formation initiator family protein [Buchnera aphidicola (Neophyllaphis varicolor)]|uniref:septum formation initiator family protein n=1 Tax=Buchnera aphidicola TaxID=9 RepID=UPI0031B86586